MFVFCVFLYYYPTIKKKTFLDLGKNIVKWLGQCFLPELATANYLIDHSYCTVLFFIKLYTHAPAAFPAGVDPHRGSEETVRSPGVL